MSSHAFADLGVSRAVVDALAARGIDAPFPVQTLVIPDVLAERDVLVKSPTGSGKTLAFGVPLVDLIEAEDPRPAALVLVPTRELAGQIVDELHAIAHARALSITAVYGGAGLDRQAKAARRAHVLVATPGRLEDLIARGAVSLDAVRVLVLDEADRMLDMGFRPAVDRIVGQTPRDRQTLFFSATLDGAAGEIADAYTSGARSHEYAPKERRKAEIEHRFVAVTRDSKLDVLVEELEEPGLKLVFVRTKHGADRLVKRLKSRGIESVAMHGNKTQGQRERALARFESGDVETLVATDVAARGLDIDDVAHVINFDPPGDSESYVHRVGRTGRAGRAGLGTTFVADDTAKDVREIAHGLRLHAEFERAGFGGGTGGGGGRRNEARRDGGRRHESGGQRRHADSGGGRRHDGGKRTGAPRSGDEGRRHDGGSRGRRSDRDTRTNDGPRANGRRSDRDTRTNDGSRANGRRSDRDTRTNDGPRANGRRSERDTRTNDGPRANGRRNQSGARADSPRGNGRRSETAGRGNDNGRYERGPRNGDGPRGNSRRSENGTRPGGPRGKAADGKRGGGRRSTGARG